MARPAAYSQNLKKTSSLQVMKDRSKVRRRDACILENMCRCWHQLEKRLRITLFNREALTFSTNDDRDDETIDTQDTSHNNWYD